VFVIPALFIVFQTLQEKISSNSPFEEGIDREQTEEEYELAVNRPH
jgi:HAE1 family hydrophobic/amphiphilic exporter-1